MIPVEITFGGNKAFVTKRGQLVTTPIAYSQFYLASAVLAATGYNIVLPKAASKFVITDIIITADKNVHATNGAIIDIYEAESPTSTVVTKEIYQDEVVKFDRISLTGLNVLIVNEGRWINVKTAEATVRVTIGGYYIPSLDVNDDSGMFGLHD